MKPTRRTLVRSAAWTVPAVSLAVAAPAYAVSNFSCPVITSTWAWDQESLDADGKCGGNLTWTVTSGQLLTGSTIMITITQPTDGPLWHMHLRRKSSNLEDSWSDDYGYFGDPGTSIELTLTLNQPLTPGGTAFINLNCSDPTPFATDPASEYSATWTINPAEPTGTNACSTNPTGCVTWFNGPGAAEADYEGVFSVC